MTTLLDSQEQRQEMLNTARTNQKTTVAAQQQAAAAAVQKQQQLIAQYAPQLRNDLNSGNYADAWKSALGTASQWSPNANVNSATTDPLIAALESSQGLQTLDPGLTMNADQMKQYYDAFGQATGGYGSHAGKGGTFNANPLGANPYGLWGTAADSTQGLEQQAAVNAQQGNVANIDEFLGARPKKNFFQKYGADIAAVALAAVAPELIGVIAPELAGAAGAAGLSTAAGSGALFGGAASAAGLAGSIGAGALVGAGSGALEGLIGGGNIGKDALLGGLGGGITQGLNASNITGGAEKALSPTLGKIGSDVVVHGLEGAGVGALTGAIGGNGAANGAAVGGIGGAISGGIGDATGSQGLGNVGGIIGGVVGNKIAPPNQPAPKATGPSQITTTLSGLPTPTNTLPTLPGTSGPGTNYQPNPVPGGALNTAGLGYAPRQEANMSGTDWANYGQGPEKQFFVPAGSQPPAQSTIPQTPTPGHVT